MAKKQYIAKIYAPDGTTLRRAFTTERPTDNLPHLKNDPNFSSRINGGFGECVLDLKLPFDDFDEGTTIDFMNVVKIYAITPTRPKGIQIYGGFISKYEPYIDKEEGVRVTALGFVSLTSFSFYKNGTNFSVVHTENDPEAIGRAIIDHVNTVYTDSLLSYSDDTTDTVGTDVTFTFEDQKWFDALKKVGELAGAGWWWKIDEQGKYWLKQKPSEATHTFTLGDDVVSLAAPKNSEKVVNDVQVRRSGDTATDYSDTDSITAFGTRSKILTDSSIGDETTADQRGQKEVADNKDEKIQATIVVGAPYEIETIKVGDTCKVRGFRKANTFFSSNMLIVGVNYLGDTVRLELEEHGGNFALELRSLVG